jgi:hypothetical protein
VRLRIQRSRATVKDLSNRLPHASRHADVRVGRRRPGVLAWRVPPVPVAVLQTRGGLRLARLSPGRRDGLRRRLDRVRAPQSGGRRPPWTPRPQQRGVARREAGPQGVGCATAWGPSQRSWGLRWRECGVRSHGP